MLYWKGIAVLLVFFDFVSIVAIKHEESYFVIGTDGCISPHHNQMGIFSDLHEYTLVGKISIILRLQKSRAIEGAILGDELNSCAESALGNKERRKDDRISYRW